MAVPKKRTSKAKKNQRKENWKKKALKLSEKYRSMTQLRKTKIDKGLIKVKDKDKNKNKDKGKD
jgi:ribosomal protein L32